MARRKQETMAEINEGPRSFAKFLSDLADGAAHAELSTELHGLVKALSDESDRTSRDAKGELTLKLRLSVAPNGTVTVNYDVAAKDPKPARSHGVFWVSPGGNLVNENPKQAKLPLRDVKAPETRDVDAQAAPVREA